MVACFFFLKMYFLTSGSTIPLFQLIAADSRRSLIILYVWVSTGINVLVCIDRFHIKQTDGHSDSPMLFAPYSALLPINTARIK